MSGHILYRGGYYYLSADHGDPVLIMVPVTGPNPICFGARAREDEGETVYLH